MAGIVGLRAEDMEQVDALQRARPDFPQGLPMVRPHVRALALLRRRGTLEAVPARFGFSRRFPSTNARVEKLETGPLWRSMFGRSHGIVPLSYVIEWTGDGDDKRPFLIQRRGGGLLLAPALVGPYHEHREELAFAICTRAPNRFFAHFHDRMIGICTTELMKRWLEPEGRSANELTECVASPGEDELEAVPTDPAITARRAGNWSPLPVVGKPIRWKDLRADVE